MMKKQTIGTGFLLSTIFLMLIVSCNICLIEGKTISNTVSLDPTESIVIDLKIHREDTLYIYGNILSGTIDLGIFDSDNYPNPSYYEEYYYDLTSSFSKEFEPIYTDTFYIEFYNPSTTNSANVSFTLDHETTFSTNLIVNISVALILLGIIIVVNFLGKK